MSILCAYINREIQKKIKSDDTVGERPMEDMERMPYSSGSLPGVRVSPEVRIR